MLFGHSIRFHFKSFGMVTSVFGSVHFRGDTEFGGLWCCYSTHKIQMHSNKAQFRSNPMSFFEWKQTETMAFPRRSKLIYIHSISFSVFPCNSTLLLISCCALESLYVFGIERIPAKWKFNTMGIAICHYFRLFPQLKATCTRTWNILRYLIEYPGALVTI